MDMLFYDVTCRDDSMLLEVTMALVSVSQAARLAGISRQQLYRGYIQTGKITVQKVQKGEKAEPKIDTSEILRVFGGMEGVDSHGAVTGEQGTTPEKVTGDNKLLAELQVKLQVLEAENRGLRDRLEEKDRRIEDKEKALGDMRHVIRLLEDMRPKQEARKPWWKTFW